VAELPAAFNGRRRRSAAKAADGRGQHRAPRAEILRLILEHGLRPNRERAGDFPPMSEDDPRYGLAAIVVSKIRARGLGYYHTGISIGSRSGFPDLTIWPTSARRPRPTPDAAGVRSVDILYRENKGSTGLPTLAQIETIVQLRGAGADAGFWWPEDLQLGVIDEELDTLAGIPQARRTRVLTPGRRFCGCPLDDEHHCPEWGRPPRTVDT
jgi:hypothetical protein